MTTLEEIRYAYVWQSCTGVESRAKEFDGWVRVMKSEAWDEAWEEAEYQDGGFAMISVNTNPYRET